MVYSVYRIEIGWCQGAGGSDVFVLTKMNSGHFVAFQKHTSSTGYCSLCTSPPLELTVVALVCSDDVTDGVYARDTCIYCIYYKFR